MTMGGYLGVDCFLQLDLHRAAFASVQAHVDLSSHRVRLLDLNLHLIFMSDILDLNLQFLVLPLFQIF